MSDATAVRPASGIDPSDGDQSLTCRVFRGGRPSPAPKDLGAISEILKEEGTLIWFDVVDPTEKDLALLREEFHLHPLSVEDAVVAHERPKIEAYATYWFLVVLGATVESSGVEFHEVAIFAGKKFLVTVRHGPPYPLEEIEDRWRAHPEKLCQNAGFLLYTILDTVVDGYLPVTELFAERVDEIEEALFADRPMQRGTLPEIFAMKKNAQRFRHAVLPMRDILNPIIRGDVDLLDEHEMPYFRDVYDHAVRVIDQLDTMRDMVNSALEINLSVVANRQNEVAKQLTIIATIFLPLSFIVGFFGQNFSFLVSHIGGPGIFLAFGIGVEVVAVVLTVGYFKVKGWF